MVARPFALPSALGFCKDCEKRNSPRRRRSCLGIRFEPQRDNRRMVGYSEAMRLLEMLQKAAVTGDAPIGFFRKRVRSLLASVTVDRENRCS